MYIRLVFTALHLVRRVSLAVSEMSVRLCVRRLNAWIVTKRNLCPHSYATIKKDASSVATRRIVEMPEIPEILDQSDPSLQKRRFPIYILS